MEDSIEKFWNWFQENNKPYLLLDEADEETQEQLMEAMEDRLHKYCDHLWFEIGGLPGEEQELIITAEGDPDFFKQVEALIDHAPIIDRWRFVAFIQPLEDDNTINFEGVELKRKEIWFMPLHSPSQPKSIGIKVCTSNFNAMKENRSFKNAIYKMLDTVLGEKSLAIDIGHVDYGQLPDKPEEAGMIELAELPAYVKWKKSKQDS